MGATSTGGWDVRTVLVLGLGLACGLTAPGAPVPPRPAAGEADGDRLLGQWHCVRLVHDGQLDPHTQPGGDRSLVLDFTPDKVAFKVLHERPAAGGRLEQDPPKGYALDPTKSPRRIDIGDKRELRGVYDFSGDRLRIVYAPARPGGGGPERDRPERFESKPGDGLVYMELKRVPRLQ